MSGIAPLNFIKTIPNAILTTAQSSLGTSTRLTPSSSSSGVVQDNNENLNENENDNNNNSILQFGKQLFQFMDKDRDGKVSLSEWKEAVSKKTKFVESLGALAPSNPNENEPTKPDMKRGIGLSFGHPSWDLVQCMLLGIQRAILMDLAGGGADNKSKKAENDGSAGPMVNPVKIFRALSSSGLERSTAKAPTEFSLKRTFSLVDGERDGWTFIDYAPYVFQQLRRVFGVNEKEYLFSLGPGKIFGNLLLGNMAGLEEVMNSGRSGSFLYRSLDGKYLIKTLPTEEKKFFRQKLPDYFSYVLHHRGTLLTRFLGLHQMVKQGTRRTYSFVVMANVLDTPLKIHQLYDLKGSTVNRSVKEDEDVSVARKDNDFQRKLFLGPRREAFVSQIESDCLWMESHGICDYSLLVGIHIEANNNKNNNTTISLNSASSAPAVMIGQRAQTGASSSSTNESISLRTGGIRAQTEQGEEKNEIYFIGIIDILTIYNFKKKSEHTLKSFFHDATQISAVPPAPYRERFVNYVKTIIV